jgi:hypothetical protein
MSDSGLLSLNCWVHGDKSKYVFLVEIAGHKNVGALKDTIKDKKKQFKDVDADTLELWKVSNPDRCVILR